MSSSCIHNLVSICDKCLKRINRHRINLSLEFKNKPMCKFLGEQISQTKCSTCNNNRIQIKVFACEIYGATTIGKRIDGVSGCCQDCPAYISTSVTSS